MADIQNIQEAWEGHSGSEVEKFIKGSLGQKVSGVRVNNSAVPKDGNGVIDLNIPVVDENLDRESGNAVRNSAVSTAIGGLESSKVASMHTTDAGDGENLMLVLANENGDEVASCKIPKASEGGNQTYGRVNVTVSKSRIKQGDEVLMTWTYNHYNSDGTPTGTAAQNIVIRVVNGTTETYRETLSNIPDNTTRSMTLTREMLTTGTVGIYVQATIIDPNDGTEQRAQGYKSVQVVSISLTSSFSPAGQLSLGGYSSGQVDIPYVITAPRGTNVFAYLDGASYDSSTINTNASTVGHFYIPVEGLASGRHNIQMVAESDGLLSDVIFCDFLVAGSNSPYLGLNIRLSADSMESMPLGYEGGEEGVINVSCEQFTDVTLSFGAWNAESVESTVIVAVDGITTQTLLAPRSVQTVQQRFDKGGAGTLTLSVNGLTRTIGVTVTAAEGVDEQEASDYVIKLTATGRSNSETNPAEWGGVTTFKNVDWKTSGWLKKDNVDTLALSNGASAEIAYRPFLVTDEYSVQADGMTVEVEMMVCQVLTRGARVMACVDGDPALGFDITTEQAALHLGQNQTIHTAETDEEGNPIVIVRELGVAMNIAPDRWMKVAFVIQPNNADGRKTFLYINGVLSKANSYESSQKFEQGSAQNITFSSEQADVYVRSVRIYRRALSHSEVLSNYIVDRPTAAEIRKKHDDNVTASEGSAMVIEPQTLISKNRGVLVIIGTSNSDKAIGGTVLEGLYAQNDKKFDGIADYIHWYSPLGRAYDFEAYNVYVRIQGTSSTKYPWKNIRIYLTKGPKTADKPIKLVVGGNDVTETAKGYALRGSANSIEQAVLCAKTDFVDSSMVLNTGGAILYDNTMRSLGLLTPPQEYDARVRQAIDGIPCDIFCGKTLTGELTYYGQHNLNNEKSKSGSIFGMEKVKDSNGETVKWDCPIALEALDNGSPMTLFQSAGSASSEALDSQLEAEFDRGFEFNYPEDTFWSSTKISDPTKESLASSAQKTAIKRLMGWLYDVTPDAMRTNPDYGTKDGWSDESKAKWVSTRFKNEIGQYFNLNHLLCYYLFTDYHASVDQRAKNILWRTWDGLIWYSTYYDGDTAHSIRNDAFMAYLYNVTRDTWDDERAKYAFEGHNSRLWCLVLANFENELKEQAGALRGVMSLQAMLTVFNDMMMGNWSERQYNESEIIKYINTMAKQNYVYTLTGNREAHRTAFLTDRSQLLDARYGTSGFQADYLGMRVGRAEGDAADNVVVKSGDLYYYGLKLANGSWRVQPIRAEEGDTVTIPVLGTLSSANDPLALCGASQITEADFKGMHGHLMGDFDLTRCVKLSRIDMNASGGVNNGLIISLGSISKIEYADFTGQTSTGTDQSGTILNFSAQRKLKTLLCGGTSLQQVILPEGAPLTRVVLPATVTRLSLRYLPNLTRDGLTLEGTANVTDFLFAGCPGLDWQELLDECPNVTNIRVEGITGKADVTFLEKYIGKRGYNAAGNPTTYPALVGKIYLTSVITEERLETLKAAFRELDIEPAQYSHYWIDETSDDPTAVTNEDNKTGFAYVTEDTASSVLHPNGYQASGYVQQIRDRCQLCAGYINVRTKKMHVDRIDRNNLYKLANGEDFDPTDAEQRGYDVFLYVPRYWYKGVNEYRKGRKHFFLSGGIRTVVDGKVEYVKPDTGAAYMRKTLDECLLAANKYMDFQTFDIGEVLDETMLTNNITLNEYKVNVKGWKQVRYPACAIASRGAIFTDADMKILSKHALTDLPGTEENPTDFDNLMGDYDFLPVPEEAEWMYFTVRNDLDAVVTASREVILTDSEDLEAVEPDWVEHKPELIGVYKGTVYGDLETKDLGKVGVPTSPLLSISRMKDMQFLGSAETSGAVQNQDWEYDKNMDAVNLPTSTMYFKNQDLFNLATFKHNYLGCTTGRYHNVTWSTHNEMANLITFWYGGRNIQDWLGYSYYYNVPPGACDDVAFGEKTFFRENYNKLGLKVWGLENFIGVENEVIDELCVNAASYSDFLKKRRIGNTTTREREGHVTVLRGDKTEDVMKYPSTTDWNPYNINVKRMTWGRYCDNLMKTWEKESDTLQAKYYKACLRSIVSSSNIRLNTLCARGVYNTVDVSGLYSMVNSRNSNTGDSGSRGTCARLCFHGEIENESDLID